MRPGASRGLREPRSGRPLTSALDLWWRELAAGKRTPLTFDALWQAAGYEYRATEPGSEAALVPSIAEARFAQAHRVILDAAKEQSGADSLTVTDYVALAAAYAGTRSTRPDTGRGWGTAPRKAAWA